MTQNWLRSCNLSLSGSSSKTISGGGTDDLRIVFSIKQWHAQSPNMGYFRVYNPSPQTVASFANKEFQAVSFAAGYQGSTGSIFQGQIKQSIYGHETATDTYVDVFAADGANGYQQARVTKTLSAGYTPKDKAQVAINAMAPFGITMGINTLDLSQPSYPRGRPFIGMARDLLRQVCLSAGGIWSIQNGKIAMTPKTLDSSSGTVSLTAASGLIGWPQQTADGIRVRSLLNPALQPLMKIKLDPSQIIQAEQNNNPFTGPNSEQNFNLDKQNLAAGTYTIFHMDRFGDTRGNDWYDESLCIGQGGILPQTQANLQYSLGNQ